MEKNVCKYCHKVFVGNARPYTCPECMPMEDQLFDAIEDYLQKFPNSNAIQVSEGLGITTKEVLNFVDEGRLVIGRGTFEKLGD